MPMIYVLLDSDDATNSPNFQPGATTASGDPGFMIQIANPGARAVLGLANLFHRNLHQFMVNGVMGPVVAAHIAFFQLEDAGRRTPPCAHRRIRSLTTHPQL